MVLDVVTIDSRVSGHLLVPSRGVPRELSRNSPSPLKLLSPFLARGNPFRGSCNIARVVPRSRLSRDYSRLSTTSSTRARAALTLAFSTRLFSLSLSRRPLSTHSLTFIFMYLEFFTLGIRLSIVTTWISFRHFTFNDNYHRII